MILEPSTYMVHNTALRADIGRQLKSWWNIHHDLYTNPSPNPVTLSRPSLKVIQSQPYVVSEKSDGMRYLLMMGRYSSTSNMYTVMIDRSMKMYQIEIFAPKEVFEGTLFDGELVYNENEKSLVFLAFDVVRYCGKSTITMNYVDRYKIINGAFPNPIDVTSKHSTQEQVHKIAVATNRIVCIPSSICRVLAYSKMCVQVKNFESMYRTINTLGHKSDGFIFTPIYSSVRKYTHRYMYKWKYVDTIDILCQELEMLCLSDNGHLTPLQKEFPQYNFHLSSDASGMIEVSVTRNVSDITLVYIRQRCDKVKPNSKKTIALILEEVDDKIQICDIANMATVAATSV